MKHLVRRRASAVLAVTLLSAAGLAWSAQPASAAPPTNDSISSATPLGAVPATFEENTSQATARADDGRCVAGASVWFRARPSVTGTVRLSTLGSDYDTVLAVYSGSKTNRTQLACRDDSFITSLASAAQVRFVAGTTYWIAVSACCSRRTRGGHLVLNATAPAPAGITAGVTKVETGAVSGRLLVTGTVHCNTLSETELDLSASQRVGAGANVARGDSFTVQTCGPQDSSWTMSVDSQSGWAFQVGTAFLSLSGFAFDGFRFADLAPQTGTFPVTGNPNAPAHGGTSVRPPHAGR